MKLKKIINYLEDLAPLKLAENFDNCGLQIGNLNQEIKKILVAVDIDNKVIAELTKHNYDLVITHHPLFFKPITQIDLNTDYGKIIETFIKNDISLYSMHTNLDYAENGTVRALINKYGFDDKKAKLIRPKTINTWCKVLVYIPEQNLTDFQEKIFKIFPSKIGNYHNCSFSSNGQGTFKPLEGANPTIGRINQFEKVDEVKFEFLIKKEEINNCLNLIKKIHPYEVPAVDIFEELVDFEKVAYAKYIKNDRNYSYQDLLNIIPAKIYTSNFTKEKINLIAFVPGSSNHLVEDLIKNEIDVLITGEMGYHSALRLELNNIAVIQLGHQESEAFVLPNIQKFLSTQCIEIEINIWGLRGLAPLKNLC